MDAFSLGWRDLILLLVALVAVYLAVLIIKLIQVGRRHPEPLSTMRAPASARSEPAPPAPPDEMGMVPNEPTARISTAAAVSAYAEEAAAHAPAAVPPAPSFGWDGVEEHLGEAQAMPLPAASTSHSAAERPRGGGFGESLAEHLARSEVEMEVQRLRDELARMRAEMDELRAARHVSPQYAEAVTLIQRGLSAQQVADRLGISLAEAELVQALCRGEGHFDEGDEHGAAGDAANDGYDAFGPDRRR
ncbi:MAG: DUF2802 domain-containing protein [Rhodocyclaceae bacterium]|nr:DUF2802 domain-containing protein [Rhodocyclaceae bacterium]